MDQSPNCKEGSIGVNLYHPASGMASRVERQSTAQTGALEKLGFLPYEDLYAYKSTAMKHTGQASDRNLYIIYVYNILSDYISSYNSTTQGQPILKCTTD